MDITTASWTQLHETKTRHPHCSSTTNHSRGSASTKYPSVSTICTGTGRNTNFQCFWMSLSRRRLLQWSAALCRVDTCKSTSCKAPLASFEDTEICAVVIAIHSIPRRPCTSSLDRATNLKSTRSPLWSSNKRNVERGNTVTFFVVYFLFHGPYGWFVLFGECSTQNVLLITSWSSIIAGRVSSYCIAATGVIVVIIRVVVVLVM